MKISFQVEPQPSRNLKHFIFKEKKYSIDFNILKRNSNYFYRNRNQFKYVDDINLLNEDEQLKEVSEETVRAFISSCQNEKCEIDLQDVIPLRYLSYKFEIPRLIMITEQFLEDYSDDLIFPSFLFKMKKYAFNEMSELNENLTEFYNTDKEENYIINHLTQFIKNDQMALLPIQVLDRIFAKCNSQVSQQNLSEISSFLFKCLDKQGRDASILFSHIDFGEQNVVFFNRLLNEYSEIFDFNMVNSTLLKTTTDLTSEMARQRIEYSNLFNAMKKKIETQEQELVKLRQQDAEREQKFEEQMRKMKENQDRIHEEEERRKQLFEEQMKEIEVTQKRINEEEEGRKQLFEEQMRKMEKNQDRIHKEEKRKKQLFEKQMKEIKVTQKRIIEEEEGRKQLFEEQMRKMEENQDRIHEEEERRKQLFEKQMEILKIKEEEFDKKLHEIKTRIGQRIDDDNQSMNDEDYPIFVKTESMKNIQLFVHPGETIAELKQDIEKKTNLQQSTQDLRFGRHILKDERTIGDYGINRYTVIELNTSIKIFIERETGEKIAFNCCLKQSIQKLKKMIQSQTDINPEDQDLVYKGKLLKNEEIITFRINSLIKLIYRPLELTFKTLTGKEFALKFSSKDKISYVKYKIFQEEGYPSDQIRLIFNGRELENDKNIQNYSILNNSIIYIVIRKSYKA